MPKGNDGASARVAPAQANGHSRDVPSSARDVSGPARDVPVDGATRAVLRKRFALNQSVAPHMTPEALIDLAAELGLGGVELHADITPLARGTHPLTARTARALAQRSLDAGVPVLSLNTLANFDDWTHARAEQAMRLVSLAEACGARALVLAPRVEANPSSPAKRGMGVHTALRALAPMLAEAGLMGLIEPLGHLGATLRHKREARAAMVEADGPFGLVHDTFHHALSGDVETFAIQTALVQVSGIGGVTPIVDLRDRDRTMLAGSELLDGPDRIDNLGQIARLVSEGYAGAFSFEPFAPAVHTLADPSDAILRSIEALEGALTARAGMARVA